MSKNIYMRLPKLMCSPIANAAVSLVLQKTSSVYMSCLKAFQNHGKMPSSQSQFHEPVLRTLGVKCPLLPFLKSLKMQSLNLRFVNEYRIMESAVKEVEMGLLRILAHMVSPNPTFLFLLD